MNDLENRARREFIGKLGKTAGLTVLCSSVIPLLSSCEEDWVSPEVLNGITIDFDVTPHLKVDPKSPFPFINLKNIGCGIIKRFPEVNYGIPVLIIKIGEHTIDDNGTQVKVPDFVCYSSMCTHNNCLGREEIAVSKILPSRGQVGENRYITCSCHGSQYDPFNNAAVIKGPSEKPLRKFESSFDHKTNKLSIQF